MISCLPYLEGNYDSVVVESMPKISWRSNCSMVAVMAALSNLFHRVHHSLAKTHSIFGLSRGGPSRSKLGLFQVRLGSSWTKNSTFSKFWMKVTILEYLRWICKIMNQNCHMYFLKLNCLFLFHNKTILEYDNFDSWFLQVHLSDSKIVTGPNSN